MALGYYGAALSRFLPTREMIELADAARIPAIGLVLFISLVVFVRNSAARDHSWMTPRAAAILMFAIFGPAIWIGGGEALSRDLGGLHAQFVPGEPASVSVTTTSQGDSISSRGCDRNVRVRHDGWPGRTVGVCAVPRGVVDRMDKGSRIRLSGFRTAYGLRYTGAEFLQ